jgi:hypothetical protein
MLETRTRNRAVATGSFDVPDDDVVAHLAITVEATESPPPDAPPSARSHRLQMEIVKAPFPLRGTLVNKRTYFPAPEGGRERDWRQIQFSRDIRFDLPGVPSVHGHPFVIKKVLSQYLPQAQGDDIPLVEDEQQVWPDGMVLQQVLTRNGDLRGFQLKGPMILPESGKRQPINFERRVDLAADTANMVIRTLDGIVLDFKYGPKQVFASGEIRDARGAVLGTLKPIGPDQMVLTFPDGATESVAVQ